MERNPGPMALHFALLRRATKSHKGEARGGAKAQSAVPMTSVQSSPSLKERNTMRSFTRRGTLAALAAAATSSAVVLDDLNPATAQTAGKPMTTASGLQIIDTQVGTG